MTDFFNNMTLIFQALLTWATQLTNFISHNLLMSFIFGFFIFRLLLGFYKKIKHIF